MLLFSRLQVIQNHSVFIPEHIRAALGLHKGTELYLSTVRCGESSLKNEIIVSQIPLQARGEIWRLRATFRDRPGILAELLHLLREESIEVVSSRTTVLEQSQVLSVELQFNADSYVSRISPNTSQWETAAGPTLPELHARILSRFIEELDFPFGAKPILSIRRNIPLYRSKIHRDFKEKTVINDNKIRISRNLEEYVRDSYEVIYPGVFSLTGQSRLPIASLVGDAENAILRIMLIYRNTGHVHIRVNATNRGESLHEITSALWNRHFNILRMYTRLLRAREETLTDFLLHLPPEFDDERDDASLRRYVSGLFKLPRLKALNAKLFFPRLLGRPGPKNRA